MKLDIASTARKIHGWPAGTRGTVVDCDVARDYYLVEVVGPNGEPVGLYSIPGMALV